MISKPAPALPTAGLEPPPSLDHGASRGEAAPPSPALQRAAGVSGGVQLSVWTCTGFTGRWPVGTAAVVVAHTAEEAAELLSLELGTRGLAQDVRPNDLVLLPLDMHAARVLCDGDY